MRSSANLSYWEVEKLLPGTYATFARDYEYKRHGTLSLLVKPSAAVLRARELAKLALKRDAFDRWTERLREIIG
jgi:hypothetical protein